jgi:hypothetical protein
MHAKEIENNILLFQIATSDVERDDFNEQLSLFYAEMNSSTKAEGLATAVKSSSPSAFLSTSSTLDEKETFSIQQQLHCDASDRFYKVLFIGKVRFTVSYGKPLDDGCVAFEDDNGTLQAGLIRAIKHSIKSNVVTVVYIEKFIIQKCLSVNIGVDNKSQPINIICADFAFAQLSAQIVPVTPNELIEKLSYIQTDTNDFIIIRYPNLSESS